MKKILLAITLSIVSNAVLSQELTKSVYIEAGGPGLLSANIDVRFSKKEYGIGGQVGVGNFGLFGQQPLIIPVGVNYLWGKNGKHYLETGIGIGVVPFIKYYDMDPNYRPTKYDEFLDNFESTFGYLSIGYRFHPKKEGLFFRAAVTPIISYDFIPYFGGLSVGYKFQNK